jgi:hypothetical protein
MQKFLALSGRAILAMIGSAALGALVGTFVAWADRLIVSRRRKVS